MDEEEEEAGAADGAGEGGSGEDFLLTDDGNDLDMRWVGVGAAGRGAARHGQGCKGLAGLAALLLLLLLLLREPHPPSLRRPPPNTQAGAAGAPDGAAAGAAVQRDAAPEPAQRARVAQARQAVCVQPHQANIVLHGWVIRWGGRGCRRLAACCVPAGTTRVALPAAAPWPHEPASTCPVAPACLPACPTEAVKTVDPDKAVGKPHTLWVAFARLYERHGDLPNARIIFEKASQVRRWRAGGRCHGFGASHGAAARLHAASHHAPPNTPSSPRAGPLQVRG